MALYHNGNFFNHASAEIDVLGKVFLGITEFNYNDELERALQYGTGAIPLGVARGQYKPNSDFTILSPEWQAMLRKLPKNGFGEVAINSSITFKEASGIMVHELRTCYITKVEGSSKQGTEGNSMKISLCVCEPIRYDGSTIVKVNKRPRLALR